MNRRVLLVLYVAAATVLLAGLMLGLMLLLALAAGLFLTQETDPRMRTLVFIGIVSLSLAGSYLLYQKVVNWLESRYEISRYIRGGNS